MMIVRWLISRISSNFLTFTHRYLIPMQSPLNNLFDHAEAAYLSREALMELHQYMKTMPQRVAIYRSLRDNEIKIMQIVADRLNQEFGQSHSEAAIERSICNGLLVMRSLAMALLNHDVDAVEGKLLSWVREVMEIHKTQAIDTALYKYLKQVLTKALNPQQMAIVEPLFTHIQTGIFNPAALTTAVKPMAQAVSVPQNQPVTV
jgi:hypothetical protein